MPGEKNNKQIFGIEKNIFSMGITSFFTDVSSEIILPVLPLFLVNVLGASMGVVGLIEGIAESTASILKVFSGWWSDRIGKRKIMASWGYTLSNIIKPFLALTTHWGQALIIRFLDRVGKGIRTSPRDAMIADFSESSMRGKAFGFHRMMDTGGAVVGTSIAFLGLTLVPESYRLLFLISAIPGVLAILIFITLVREPPRLSPRAQEIKLDLKPFDPKFKKFIAVSICFALSNFSYAFLILRTRELGVILPAIPLFYLLFNIVYALFTMPAGIASDRIGRKIMLVSGYFTFGLMCVGFIIFRSLWLILLLFGLYGIFKAIQETVSRAYVSDLVPSERRGTALGMFYTFVGISTFPASLLAGILWQIGGALATFSYGAGLAILSGILLMFLIK